MEGLALHGEQTAAVRRVPFVYLLIAATAAILAVFSVVTVGSLGPWVIVLAVVAIAGLALPVPQWVARCAPLVLIGVVFLALGGVADHQAVRAVSTTAIDFDRAVTGSVLPVWLQQHLAVLLGAPAAILTVEYLLHFIAPLLTALWLWRRHPAQLDRFVAVYMLAMLVGFGLYLAFPLSPPWFASEQGLLPPLHRTVVEVLQSVHAGALYAAADPEPLGAMPSLHVTIPLIVAVQVAIALRSRWRWLWLLYPLTVAFGVLLMAEHYLLDTVAGVLLGAVALLVVHLLPDHVVSGVSPAAAAGRAHQTKGTRRRVARE
jgi:hypothetical protein